ncbi:MAG: hypothetical protein JWM47_4551 [Acidimicrobiales bacterium]|nr:hypothetical protein [Acidimicrobiales bacterium]
MTHIDTATITVEHDLLRCGTCRWEGSGQAGDPCESPIGKNADPGTPCTGTLQAYTITGSFTVAAADVPDDIVGDRVTVHEN